MPTNNRDIAVKVNRSPNGRLNSDTDVLELNGGDYTGRVNVEFNSDGTTFSDTPSLGNLAVVNLGEQGLQSQRTRIYLDKTFTNVNIELLNINRQTLGLGNAASENNLASNKAAIVSIFNSFAIPATFFNDVNSFEYIDVELALGFSDWSIVITNQDNDNVRNTILIEAIGNTGVGVFKEIGAKDLYGTTFLMSTTQDNVLTEYKPVLNMFRVGSAIYVTINNHELSTNDSIVIANATGDGANGNGQWVVTFINANLVALNASIAGAMSVFPVSYGGTVFLHPYGVGQIGVQQYNANDDTYTYIKLIASKRFNFVTSRQIDVDGEVNNRGWLLKFTDNYNYPRTFSYNGEFMENWALTSYNEEDGLYTYDGLVDDLKNIINYSAANVKYFQQIQTGGALNQGNWRYAVQFLTDTLAPTELSLLSNPIPTFSTVYSEPTDVVYGNAVGNNSTTKINQVQVTGITAGRFQFVQLVAFNYVGGLSNTPVIDAFVVRREQLDPEQTEIILEHNGLETDVVFFDATSANLVRPDIVRVGSNRLIDNRLVYANVTTSNSIDIREWALTFKYSIKRFGLYGSFGDETFYEFFNPQATHDTVGYQPYEWYRVYVAAELYSGKLTDAAFCFDVRMVTQTNYNPNEFPDNGGDRRDLINDDYIDYSLGEDRFLYQLYLEINNINWDYRIDGVSVRDLFRSVKIMRAERVKEVIASGTSVAACTTGVNQLTDWRFGCQPLNQLVPNSVIDYDGISAQTLAFPPNKFFCSFYSSDIIFGNETYEFAQGDELINFGCLAPVSTQFTLNGTDINTSWRLFKGDDLATGAQVLPIVDSVYIDTASNDVIDGVTVYQKLAPAFAGSTLNGSSVLKLSTEFINASPNVTTGIYQTLLFRRTPNKYGDVNAIGNTIIYTGATAIVDQASVSVFGGDVFNQQLQYRHINKAINTSFAAGYNLISQNIINVNLRAYNPATPTNAFPVNQQNFATWLNSTTAADYTKNIGYSIFNNVQSTAVFDALNRDRGIYPTRKYWSQLSPNNSFVDRYREFLPLDFQDNPNVFGEITHIEDINRELFTFQKRGFTREFFNNVGRLQTIEDGSVNIGNGSVLSREGLLLSIRGTQHKWSVVKGISDGGKAVAYWVDAEFGTIMRFGDDGASNLTERAMYSTFVRNNTRLVTNKYTPANNQGIHAIWDDVGKNYIVTCRAWVFALDWFDNVNYSVGDLAIFGEEFGVPVIYIATADNIGSVPSDLRFWERIPFSNNEYYNVWTLVFNEKKNAFTHHYTFYPKIYHTLNNRYFSPSPVSTEQNIVYRHRELKGQQITYYGVGHTGYTEYVINYVGQVMKKFVALGWSALRSPLRAEVDTQYITNDGIQDRTTFMERSAIDMRENAAKVGVRNNVVNGQSDVDSAPMRGLWAKIRTFFNSGENQKINDTTVVVRMSERNVLNP